MKAFTIIGLGRFGSCLAKELSGMGAEVMAIDKESEHVQHISNFVTGAAVGDACDIDVLRTIGVSDCDCAVIAIGDDIADSVMITMNLKELGVPYVVCKAHDDMHSKVLNKLGADKIIIPERVVAERLAHSLCAPKIMEYIELSDNFAIIEIPSPSSWVGSSIRTLNVRAKYKVNIIAIKTNEKIDVSPDPDYQIGEADIIVVLGDNNALSRVQKLR